MNFVGIPTKSTTTIITTTTPQWQTSTNITTAKVTVLPTNSTKNASHEGVLQTLTEASELNWTPVIHVIVPVCILCSLLLLGLFIFLYIRREKSRKRQLKIKSTYKESDAEGGDRDLPIPLNTMSGPLCTLEDKDKTAQPLMPDKHSLQSDAEG